MKTYNLPVSSSHIIFLNAQSYGSNPKLHTRLSPIISKPQPTTQSRKLQENLLNPPQKLRPNPLLPLLPLTPKLQIHQMPPRHQRHDNIRHIPAGHRSIGPLHRGLELDEVGQTRGGVVAEGGEGLDFGGGVGARAGDGGGQAAGEDGGRSGDMY